MAIEEVGAPSQSTGQILRLLQIQEFSIEIPDKEADAIQSGMSSPVLTG